MTSDPDGPRFLIVQWSPGDNRPTKRLALMIDNFKISRTYSLSATLSAHAASGVSIRNKVFSDMTDGDLLVWTVRETQMDEVTPWRKGYYDQPRPWEDEGPEPGEKNSITRRFSEQKLRVTASMPSARPSFLETCSSKALSLRKAAMKKKRQLERIRPQDDSSESSSDSSGSSSQSTGS